MMPMPRRASSRAVAAAEAARRTQDEPPLALERPLPRSSPATIANGRVAATSARPKVVGTRNARLRSRPWAARATARPSRTDGGSTRGRTPPGVPHRAPAGAVRRTLLPRPAPASSRTGRASGSPTRTSSGWRRPPRRPTAGRSCACSRASACPTPRIERAKAALPLPPGGRGVLVDSGTSLRAIVTGQPTGERLVEVRLGEDSSFDAWVHGEWVREVLFRNFDDALRRAPALVREYLTTHRGAPIG